jgi:multidrug efflux pump subunit AcrA (membrane-fusion protein)
MHRKKDRLWLLFFLTVIFAIQCRNNPVTDEKDIKACTPVTITGITTGPLVGYDEFNATSTFQNKGVVRATTSGFLSAVYVNPGDHVSRGTLLFIIVTREAAALKGGNASMDSSIHFKGEVKIRAEENAIVSSNSYQKGDYVQEGDELATLADPSSLVYLLQIPFETAVNIHAGQHCEIILPDESRIDGCIGSMIPSADLPSQSVAVVVKPSVPGKVPENLIVRVKIARSVKKNACTLPKEAVLTNETLTSYWVMKLINDSVAVKVPVQKGMEQGGNVEILDPVFQKADRFILTGNYGLEDTARITIVK